MPRSVNERERVRTIVLAREESSESMLLRVTLLKWIQFIVACVTIGLVSLAFTKFLSFMFTVTSRQRARRVAVSFYVPFRYEYKRQFVVSDLQLACRQFGVRSSMSGETLNAKALDGFKVARGVPLAGTFSAFYLPIAAFVVATLYATPFVRDAL